MNIEPVFVDISDVFEIHQYQIQRFGGTDGLRSIELLESAIAMPSATFGGQYLYPTIPDMAASYLFHLVENHPFVDGNKRTGAMVAIYFLTRNNYLFDATNEELSDFVLRVAAGEKTLRGISFFFHRHAHTKHSRKRNI